MPNASPGQPAPPIDRYPWRVVFVRWALLAIEAFIGIYFVLNMRLELGIIFIVYGVVCLFLLLPIIRCVRCAYYGKRCNFGWGVWVAKIFPRDEVNSQTAFYGYTLLFWPLRIIPILLGFMKFLGGFTMVIAGRFEEFHLVPHALFLIYIAALILHRPFYRSVSCPKCHERLQCPVYNSRAMLTHSAKN
jgi:hypothetical protein